MRTGNSLLLFCLAVSCGAVSARAASPELARPRLVGRLETTSLETAHPYAPDGRRGAWTRTLRDPGATYLRIHFKRFELAEGDQLEIADAAGLERRVYSGRGPLGRGSFWAFTVPGDTAVFTLRAASGGGDGFEIDSYGRGVVPILGASGAVLARAPEDPFEQSLAIVHTPDPGQPEEPDPTGLVCGQSDLNDVACYRYEHPVAYHNAGAAVLAIQGCCSASTAFKVSDTGQFMSAYRTSVEDVELRLGYQSAWCGDDSDAESSGAVMGSAILKSDPVLDFTLFSTAGDSSAIPCLQLDRRKPDLGERIFIPQHPWGGPKKMAIRSDMDLGGLCAVDPIPLNLNLNPPTDEIGFFCDTTEGSLGAPVVSSATERVVGINHMGRCPNTASRMDLIWPRISSAVKECTNGFACQPVSGARCDCNGTCSNKERNYIDRGGNCPDCWEEPEP